MRQLSISRVFGMLASLVLVSFALAVLPASVSAGAPARAGCSGVGCNSQDPNVMGCGADATTAEEFTAVHANSGRSVRVELRQSHACRARWLRVTPYAGSGGCSDNSFVRLQDLYGSGGVKQTRSSSFGLCGGQVVTWMVGRDSDSQRTIFGYRSDPYSWNSHPSFAPQKSQQWGAW